MNWLRPVFRRHPFADHILCHFLSRRLTLPALCLSDFFPGFDQRIVRIAQVPRGSWSTPLADLVMLVKIALCGDPRRLLELGSYRGETALQLAQHISPEAQIVTIDRHPEHGVAYRETRFENMIQRRVGQIDRAMFAADEAGSYDLIFLDADHSYEGTRHDTELVLPLLAATGFIVWHDYANWGFFSGENGVPEYLAELSAKIPIASVRGSTLAIHSPSWISGPASERFRAATLSATNKISADPWQDNSPRG